MSNGEPIVVRAAMKPLSTLRRSLESVDLKHGGRKERLRAERRHRRCPRRPSFCEASVAIVPRRVVREVRRGFAPRCAELRGVCAQLGAGGGDLLDARGEIAGLDPRRGGGEAQTPAWRLRAPIAKDRALVGCVVRATREQRSPRPEPGSIRHERQPTHRHRIAGVPKEINSVATLPLRTSTP